MNHTLRMALGNFATGVTVVTTHCDGVDVGMTCNSFASVSLDPALVLWSLRKESASREAFLKGGGYTINVLSAQQELLATNFTKGSHADRFCSVSTERLDTGRLKLNGCASWFDCALERVVSAGDHDIFIGKVLDYGFSRCNVLAYAQSTFGSFIPAPVAEPAARQPLP